VNRISIRISSRVFISRKMLTYRWTGLPIAIPQSNHTEHRFAMNFSLRTLGRVALWHGRNYAASERWGKGQAPLCTARRRWSWSRLARWVATEPEKTHDWSGFPITCREMAERERDFGSQESLESALSFDPNVPWCDWCWPSSRKIRSVPHSCAIYDLKRLPDDPVLWARAATSLHEQHDDVRAHRAMDKLATLAPDQAKALRDKLGL